MKKLYFVLALALGSSLCNAQVFPTQQRAMIAEDGIYTCDPCYTWAKPMMDHFKAIYDSNLICYSGERMLWGPNPVNSNFCDHMFTNMYSYPMAYAMGSPSMFVNQYYVEDGYGDSAFMAITTMAIDSTISKPAVVSPIFEFTAVGTDSMVINTKTKFMQDADGDYRIGILLLQDSIYFQQTGSSTGMIYHMHQLTGPDYGFTPTGDLFFSGMDSACYTLGNGHIAQNTIVDKEFHYKLKTTQVMKDMHPVAIVWKYAQVNTLNYTDTTYFMMDRLTYVNANEKPGINYSTGTASVNTAAASAYTASVYPNPASNILNIKLQGVDKEVKFHLYDITGREVLSQVVTDRQSIDISNLVSGQYTYTFNVGNSAIMKEHVSIIK